MSVIDITVARRRLRLIGTHADVDLQQALDGAEAEAVQFLNCASLPRVSDAPDAAVQPDVVEAVLLLVKASFEAASPDEIAGYRRAAETRLYPHRKGIGA